MGKVGREIVGESVEEIIRALNQAVGAEGNDAYRYRLLSLMAEGINAREVAEVFTQMAVDEWNHQQLFVTRILELGGRPLESPADWASNSYTGYMAPPKDSTDLRKMIEDSLVGERDAIRFYAAMVKKTADVDPVTRRIFEDALADEVRDEENLENLLAKL